MMETSLNLVETTAHTIVVVCENCLWVYPAKIGDKPLALSAAVVMAQDHARFGDGVHKARVRQVLVTQYERVPEVE